MSCQLVEAYSRLALLFVVAEFSIVPAFDQVIAIAWSGRMAPPSTELPRSVPGLLPMVGIVFSD